MIQCSNAICECDVIVETCILMLRSKQILHMKNLALHLIMVISARRVEFYRLYNLRASDLMLYCCRDFCDFHTSLPSFFQFFAVIFYCP